MDFDTRHPTQKAFETLERHCDYILKKLDLYDNKMKECQKAVMHISGQSKSTNEFLEHILQTHILLQDTLQNVLIAIQQNKELQAWYPAQSGYPEMHVTGMHPSKLEQEKRDKE